MFIVYTVFQTVQWLLFYILTIVNKSQKDQT